MSLPLGPEVLHWYSSLQGTKLKCQEQYLIISIILCLNLQDYEMHTAMYYVLLMY